MFYKDGLYFKCKQCSACCRHEPGVVILSDNDIMRLCKHLRIEADEFIEKYCKSVYNSKGYRVFSLIETRDYDCIFWSPKGCKVYRARPVQCRTYPFWDEIIKDEKAWNSEAKNCPGMNSGDFHSKEKIKRINKKYRKEYYD